MTTIGYAYKSEDQGYLSSQLESLGKYGCDRIVLETDDQAKTTHPHVELEATLETMEAGDQLIIFELVCLGKSVIQLADFIAELDEKGVELIVLEKDEALKGLDNKVFTAMITNMAKMEKAIIRERTSRGLEEARRNGRIGGRPRISEETVERVQFLYHNNKYTLRQIAEECNISLGTAYKYTQESIK
ncbi:recombinase family protein [Vagococcus sp. BWB3-3]|uniref:Recombinase family protein n=1 Tax=Vagococcus allomyrinae TaxID=2794353 RepID=A0A940PHP5_9ENTE|nr:recombinase family protein [Vagococcus allomyrinae]MBP1043776.1 recombinase family protein [Vagococcus allomyrinae]